MDSENSLTTLGFWVLIKTHICNPVISTEILEEEHLKITIVEDRPTEISVMQMIHAIDKTVQQVGPNKDKEYIRTKKALKR